jgi:uncharacterized membrane protein YhaH (DUF805 family)
MKSAETGSKCQTRNTSDLDVFRPAPPSKRIDDKAATLEAEVTGLKTAFNRERFIYIFVSSLLTIMAIGPYLSGALLSILVVGVVIFVLGMGKYLDFPWIVLPLERWHDVLLKSADKWLNGQPAIGIEPPQNGNAKPTDKQND